MDIRHEKFFTKRWPTILFISLFAFSFHCIRAQNKQIDSLKGVLKISKDDTSKVNVLNLIGRQFFLVTAYDSAAAYADRAKALAEKLGFKKGIANADRGIGNVYTDEGNYQKALEMDLKAFALDSEIENQLGVGKDLGNIGNIYMDQGYYQKALEYDSKALTICQKSKNREGTALNMGNLGNIYYRLGNLSEGLKYYLLALADYKEIGNKNGIARNLGNIGNLYTELKNYPLALEYEVQSLQIAQEMDDKASVARALESIGANYRTQKNYTKSLQNLLLALEIGKEIDLKSSIAVTLGSIGMTYRMMNNYGKTLDYYLQSLQLYNEIGEQGGVAFTYLSIGEVYSAQKKYSLAKDYLDKGLTASKKVGEKNLIETAYQYISCYDTLNGDFRGGMNAYQMFIRYRDSITNEANTKQRVQAEMSYEFEQQQVKDKAEQNKKDALADQDRKKQAVIRNLFIGGFAMMLVFALLIFRGYRQKQKANVIITQQKDEVERQKNLVEEKQKEILDSIHYSKRIQKSLLPTEKFISKNLNRLNNKK